MISLSDIEEVDSLLKTHLGTYISTGVETVILLAEGFEPNVVKPYISDTWMRSFLNASAQNPVFLLYIPLLMNIRPDIEKITEKISDKVGEDPKVKNIIERYVSLERKVTLVSLALASKYVLYIDLERHKGYIEFFIDMLDIIAEVVKGYLDDLDPVEKVSLLYIYEIQSLLRNKLSKTISWPQIDDKANLPLTTKTSVASLLYDIYKITRKEGYLTKFYDILSEIDFKACYITFRETETHSTDVLKKYYDLDDESLSALSFPLNEIEFTLLAKLVKIIKSEFVTAPIIGFSDFVSKYYHIPKRLLKAWLLVTLFVCNFLGEKRKTKDLEHKIKYFDHFAE